MVALGGGSGIRTHGELAPTPVFKTGALNRSAIPPDALISLASQPGGLVSFGRRRPSATNRARALLYGSACRLVNLIRSVSSRCGCGAPEKADQAVVARVMGPEGYPGDALSRRKGVFPASLPSTRY